MIQLKRFENLQMLADFNCIEDPQNYFVFYTLNQALDRAAEGLLELYDGFNLIDENNNSILTIWLSGNLFFYSSKFTEELVDKLVDEIPIHNFRNFEITGQTDLLLELIKRTSPEIEVKKNRLIYECETVLPNVRMIGNIREPNMNDFHDLVEMSWAWYVEEYHGAGPTPKQAVYQKVMMGISQGGYYVLDHGGVIASMVCVINDHENFSMIGNFYTKPEFRNQGFGSTLLHAVTDGLLKSGYLKCGLISDLAIPASNRVFEKIGYVPIYKSTWAYKQNRG